MNKVLVECSFFSILPNNYDVNFLLKKHYISENKHVKLCLKIFFFRFVKKYFYNKGFLNTFVQAICFDEMKIFFSRFSKIVAM